MSTIKDPSITVIIATFNANKSIDNCIISIVNQTYSNIELIIIDNKSTDGTQTTISNYNKNISYFISEPDTGIYNAWNKAIKRATGTWICFLGADDYFWSDDVIQNLIPYLDYAKRNNIKVVYGELARIDSSGKIVSLVGTDWKKIAWLMPHGMPLPHPGLMHHSTLFSDHGLFDETFKIAGDYEMLLRVLLNGEALYVPGIRIGASRIGGIADSNDLRAKREVARARNKHGLPSFSWVWTLLYLRSLIRLLLKKIRENIMLK